jgi:pyruvate dehydrogenase E1 component beta subunit
MLTLNLLEAINNALDTAMGMDPTVVVFGEDSGVEGGVFRATVGLQQKYGKMRCFDSVLAESSIIGSGIGMAINGLKPVAEIQFAGFVFPGYNQIVTHAARMRNRTRGKYTVPMVIRMPVGAGVRALEHHSESLETIFASVPGLKVVIPSTPYDAKGLLLAAINDPDPVIFMEPTRIYRAFKQEVPEGYYDIPIGKAKVLEEGTDLTVVAWGAIIRDVQKAIERLKGEGHSIELIDLRTISPFDKETIVKSVKKTGRFAVVHEAVKSFGPGAELMAMVNEEAFLYLEAPPKRITGQDIIIPLPKGEHHFLPDEKYIASQLKEVLIF